MKIREISLRPYPGKMFVAYSAEEFERAHKLLFNQTYRVTKEIDGHVTGGENKKDNHWAYLVWGRTTNSLAHEIAHVILHLFERCDIDPRSGNGEPFCFMLLQLMNDAEKKK